MAAEDFDDDTKDGGEMGAGHTVTALYEIALTDSAFEISEPELKYDKSSNDKTAETVSYVTASDGVNAFSGMSKKENTYASSTDELFTLNVRYKEPDSDTSQLETYVCTANDYSKNGSDNLRWAAAVAEFGLILRDSEYKGNANADNILSLAKSALNNDDEYKQEFIELVKTYSNNYFLQSVQ
jgi:Ca-activated chloride channel family protein